MKALISPEEKVALGSDGDGVRIAQVEQVEFEVAHPLFWVDCPSECTAENWYFDPVDNVCKLTPPLDLE
jgi:hypothetical protein